jgi:hypothetical protein
MKINIVIVLLMSVFVSVILAHSSYTGYTLKTSSTGCSCHGTANSSVSVFLTGPSQVTAGATATYQVIITGGSGSQVSVDIAASSGTLSAYDSALKLSGTELITNGTKTYSSGSYTYSFNYTAPSSAGSQTLYATGLSSTSAGWNFAPNKTISVVTSTGVSNNPVHYEWSLDQNYPNPFNPSSFIKFSIPQNEFVTLKVYNILGKEVATLINESKAPGNYDIKFDGGKLASGIYLYKITAGSFTQTDKMILMK